MAPLSRRMRWLGAITGLFVIPAMVLLGSLLAALYAVPLFLGAIFANRWPWGGRGLMWVGALFASAWAVPYAIGMVFEPGPSDLIIVGIKLLFVIAGVLTVSLDVGLSADAIRRARTRRQLPA